MLDYRAFLSAVLFIIAQAQRQAGRQRGVVRPRGRFPLARTVRVPAISTGPAERFQWQAANVQRPDRTLKRNPGKDERAPLFALSRPQRLGTLAYAEVEQPCLIIQ